MRPAPSTVVRGVAAAAVGYLAGTFPTADLVSRAAGAGDLRTQGTGNPGAANAIATMGPKWGYVVLVGDIAKGVVGSTGGRLVGGDVGAHIGGTASVVGHCYPVWNGGKGGKGVAASAGQALATFPAYFVPDLLVAGLITVMPWWKERSFAAAVVSSSAWTAAGVVWWRRQWPNLWGPRPTAALPLAAAATSGVIMTRFAQARAAARTAQSEPSATNRA